MERNTAHGDRHMLLLTLCCLIPLAAMGAIFVLKIPVPRVMSYGLILLYPLSHVLMMRLMGRGQHDHAADTVTRTGAETAEIDAMQTPGQRGRGLPLRPQSTKPILASARSAA